jgi:hypothetical protein
MLFDVVAHYVGTTESFWDLHIPRHNIIVPFLFVMLVREPVVYMLDKNIHMTPIVVGSTSVANLLLVNQESVALSYKLVSEGKKGDVVVEPTSGTLQPNSETKIK